MDDKAKLILGTLAGVAVGVGLGLVFSDKDITENIKESLSDVSDRLNGSLKELVEEHKDLIDKVRNKMASDIPGPGPSAQEIQY
jgi:hypothetical protein